MALEGTHIRFALDVKDKYKVKALGKYLSGAVYPDSRYVSKIKRELTHPPDFMSWDVLKLDDFRKGWFVHLLYDDLQYHLIINSFPNIGEGPQGSEPWVRLSAVKNLEDIDNMVKFNIKPYLNLLDYVENPNGEKIEDMERYNKAVQEMYSKPVDIDSCVSFWLSLGQTGELSDKIKLKSEEYSRDKQVMARVKNIYSETLKKANLVT